MENEKIIQQLRSGDNRQALQEMYKSFPSIRHFICTHGGNDDDARDLFQESLMVFYKNALKPEFSLTSSLNTYIFSICKYLWKDELKKKNRLVNFEFTDFTEEISSHQEDEAKMTLLDKVLDGLGEKCSGILQLFYYKKKSMEEIATQLEYKNVDTAKTQKYKCLERAKTMADQMKHSFLHEGL